SPNHSRISLYSDFFRFLHASSIFSKPGIPPQSSGGPERSPSTNHGSIESSPIVPVSSTRISIIQLSPKSYLYVNTSPFLSFKPASFILLEFFPVASGSGSSYVSPLNSKQYK